MCPRLPLQKLNPVVEAKASDCLSPEPGVPFKGPKPAGPPPNGFTRRGPLFAATLSATESP